MERSEPSLVPEWLKSSGSVTSAGTLRPRSSSSSLSDDHPRSRLVRNKSSLRNIDQDLGRTSSNYDSISPSFSHRSYSSNGSSHSSSYSNFGRNNRGRDWDRDVYEYQDKNRKVYGDHREKDISPMSTFSGFEKDGIRSSQSMFSGRRSDVWPKKPFAGANGMLEKDAYVGTSASAISSGGKWISALAEAPTMVEISDTNIVLEQKASVSSSLAQNKCSVTGLNMAEAVSLGPLQTQTNSQLSTRSQRLEELTLKQSRQLVPVTPATPKPLTMTSLDKVKGGKHVQLQHPSTVVSPWVRAGTMKADMSKTGNTGKLQVLKPSRERNVVTSTTTVKDSSSISADNPPSSSPLLKRPTSSPVSSILHTFEKRPVSQGQSRNEFFNLVRKKSGVTSDTQQREKTVNCTTAIIELIKEGEVEVASTTNDRQNGIEVEESGVNSMYSGDDENNNRNGKTRLSPDLIISEEEEAAFLRSLGWEENSDEDDGLTEEEISAFYRDLMKYMESKPSSKLFKGVGAGVLLPEVESHVGAADDAVSSGLRSSDLKLES